MNILNNVMNFNKALDIMYHDTDYISVHHMEGSNKKFGDASEYGYNSWLDYWKKHSDKKLTPSFICPCCHNSVKDVVGAHVEDNEENIYITPVCKDCNSRAANNATFRETNFPVSNDVLVPF